MKVVTHMNTRSPWLVRQSGRPCTRRLYCFHYAGGNAGIFTAWRGAFGPEVEVCAVQLPGRGTRIAEMPPRSFPAVVEQIADAIAADPPLPFGLFGHSLGGLLAFEVTRLLAARGQALPGHLIVSGCEAPAHRTPARPLHLLSDDELIAELRDLNGTPAEVLDNRELMAMVLPAVRADFGLVYDYAYRPGPALAMPITVLAGARDHRCRPENMERWLDHGAAGGRVHWFEGDHFFIHAERDAVLACVRRALDEPLFSQDLRGPTRVGGRMCSK